MRLAATHLKKTNKLYLLYKAKHRKI